MLCLIGLLFCICKSIEKIQDKDFISDFILLA